MLGVGAGIRDLTASRFQDLGFQVVKSFGGCLCSGLDWG